ncbi:hypothetical protein D039_3802B, partial [Vibrio parahaemolyticus EKP-028]
WRISATFVDKLILKSV